MKAKYALEGVIYEYDESNSQAAEEFDKVRQVPQDRIVATFEGSWKGQITWKKKGDKVSCMRHLARNVQRVLMVWPTFRSLVYSST